MEIESSVARIVAALFSADRKAPLKRAVAQDALAKKTGLSAEEVAHALTDLSARGLAAAPTPGRWLATAGAGALLPKAERRTPGRVAAPKADALDGLRRELGSRFDALEAKVDRVLAALAGAPAARALALGELQQAIRVELRTLSNDRRLGGLVPVGELRRRVIESTRAGTSDVDHALVEMDRAFELDLKVSNDPSSGPGVRVPGRGEAHFVVAR